MKHTLLLLTAFFCVGSAAAQAVTSPSGPAVRCTAIYGGEARTFDVEATTNPYTVESLRFGSRRFEFKVVFVASPDDIAGVNIYTFYPTDQGPVLIHQAKYRPPYPVAAQGSPHGFTGLHFIYEPERSSEFQYWCAWRPL